MDIKIYIFYEAVFIVIFSELLFALAKGLDDSKNFFKQKKKDDKKRRLLSKVEQKNQRVAQPKRGNFYTKDSPYRAQSYMCLTCNISSG